MRNILVRTDIPANVISLGARIRSTRLGVKVAQLPDDVAIVWADREDFARENARVLLPATDPSLVPFAHPEWIPSSQEIREFGCSGSRGIVRDLGGRTHCVQGDIGLPIVLAKAHLLLCPPAAGLPALSTAAALFKPRPDGRLIVPFVGEIHVKGSSLTDDQLAVCGLEWLKDDTGRKLEYIFLEMGNRSIFVPSRLGLGLSLENSTGVPLGWQFKGTGVRRYAFHTVMDVEDRFKPADPDDLVLVGPDTAAIPHGIPCQRPVYAGGSGVFVDLRHQPSSDVPVGGETDLASTIATYAELKGKGASLAREPGSAAALIQRDTLDKLLGCPSGMTVRELVVPCEVWVAEGGSTIRLDAVTQPLRVYRSFAEGLRQASTTFTSLVALEYGSADRAARDDKLRSLARRLGINCAAAFEAGRTVYFDRNTDDNLTTRGWPLDYGDYHPASGWWQMASLVCRSVLDLQRLARAAGLNTVEFFTEGFAAVFLREFLSAEEAQGIAGAGAGIFGQGPGFIEVAETREYVVANVEFSAQATCWWACKQLTVNRNEVAQGRRYMEPRKLVSYTANSAEICRCLQRSGFSFNGGTVGVEVVSELFADRTVSVSRPSCTENMDLLGVAALLIPFYLFVTLKENILLKDQPEKWRTSPPIEERKDV